MDDAVRATYRAAFAQAAAEGRASPLLIPYGLLGTFVLPVLWLTLPHTQRPWLYSTRWLVMAVVAVVAVDLTRQSSSTNLAQAYTAGLVASWGLLSGMNLMIWRRPQFDAARAVKVSNASGPRPTNAAAAAQGPGRSAALRRRKGDGTATDGSPVRQGSEVGRDVYVWQPFPAAAPFLERLGWVLDLAWSFRGSGWNWSISSIPRPQIPTAHIQPGDPVDLASMPRVTASGYRRCLTEREFARQRLFSLAAAYLVLDLCSVLMMKDPYFIFGPDSSYELPPRLRHLSPWLLLAYRELLSLAGILGSIVINFSFSDLLQYWFLKFGSPARAGLWRYASTFGSFSQVLDRGLAGWWGDWWHQTFRQQFLAPSTYLLNQGYLSKGTQTAAIAATFISFAQSGLLHAFASLSSIPTTKPWRSMAFFLLQPVGIFAQQALAKAIEPFFPRPSRALTRVANLLFALTWLYTTAVFIIDDFASAGMWLLEPVPISPLRWLGYGNPTDHWWRWDQEHFSLWQK